MQQKKPTNADLTRKIQNAVVFVPKDKDTKTTFFMDKGLRITVTDDYAVIETQFHRHVFDMITSSGVSRPYIYTKQVLDIALENNCDSMSALFEKLKGKEDKTEYNIVWYYNIWLTNIFAPLYEIDETNSAAFLVYETYLHTIARQEEILKEKTSDVTTKDFIRNITSKLIEYTEYMDDSVIFQKVSDEELLEKEIAALQESDFSEEIANELGNEKVLNQQNGNNEGKD